MTPRSRTASVRLLLSALLLVACQGIPEGEPGRAKDPPVEMVQLPFTNFSQLRPGVMRDVRIFVDFSASSINAETRAASDRRQEVRRGLHMAMDMWQSVLPDLRIREVETSAEANVVLNISAGSGGNAGSASPPTASGDLGGFVSLSDGASSVENYIYRFADFDFAHMRDAYASYRPATYPPEYYHGVHDGVTDPGNDHNPGHVNGRFWSGGQYAGADVSMIGFHELGHSLGMNHYVVTPQEAIAWYGLPRAPDGTTPAQPAVRNVDRVMYPDIPATHAPSYYGGGTNTNGTLAGWTSGLGLSKSAHPMLRTRLRNSPGSDGPAMAPGIPSPPYNLFNNRIVTDLDLAQLPPYDFRFPRIAGLIRMERHFAGARQVYLTSSWTDAEDKSQIGQVIVRDPWFVTGVFPRAQTITRVSAGDTHVLAVRSDGTLWAWGKNDKGQIGDGTTTDRPSPVQIGTAKTWVSVAAGASYSMGLRSDGTVWTWGWNPQGNLGDGTTTDRRTPTPLCNVSGQACFGNRYVAISAYALHGLGLKNDGTLWGWGYNGEGQLGVGHNNASLFPVQEAIRSNGWVSVAGGSNHTLALQAEGTLWAWGYNADGELGLGHTSNLNVPTQLGGDNWLAIGPGRFHSAAIDKDHRLWTWGQNTWGQLGDGTTTPRTMPVLIGTDTDRFIAVAGGGGHTLALRTSGAIAAFGLGSSGQLGNGNTGSGPTLVGLDTRNTANNDFVELAPRLWSSLALKGDGSLWSWGSNNEGQLGTGGASPSPVTAPTASRFAGRLAATTSNVNPSGDGHIRNGSSANTNYGTATTLEVGHVGTTERRSYLAFDLSSLSDVKTVRLRFRASASGSGRVTVEIHPVIDTTWTESGLKWNNAPPHIIPNLTQAWTRLGSVDLTSTSAQWFEVDISSWAKSQRLSGRRVDVALVATQASSGPYARISSRQATTSADRPRLVVTR